MSTPTEVKHTPDEFDEYLRSQMKGARTHRRIIARDPSGKVNLVILRKRGSAQLYAVTYPAKVGGIESETRRESQQFLDITEARRCFERFAHFYWDQQQAAIRKAKGE